MERPHIPSKWDSPPRGSSSQKPADGNASKRTVSGNIGEAFYNRNTLGEHERRAKLTQAYGRSLLSALQSFQLPPSPSSMNPTFMVPSGQIPAPSGRNPPPSVDESSQRSNPFPSEFRRKTDEKSKREAPKPQVSGPSSANPSVPVHNVRSSTPISPVANLDMGAIHQQIMLAGINALAMNNPSLQAQLLLGQNNTAKFDLPLIGANVKSSVPDGSGLLKYRAPDMGSFVFDEKAGYRFDPATGLHYDANSGLFINLARRIFLRWDSLLNTYLRVDLPGSGQTTGLNIPVSVLPAEVIQSQAPSAVLGINPLKLVNPTTTVPPAQDSFMNEIWQRMRALAKEAIGDSQTTQNPREAVGVKSAEVCDENRGISSDSQRRKRHKHASGSQLRSTSREDRRKSWDRKHTGRSRSSSRSSSSSSGGDGDRRSTDSAERHKGRKRSRSRHRGTRKTRSRGRSTHSRSPSWVRRRRRSRGSRRSRSTRRRSFSRSGRRSHHRGHSRSISHSPGRSRCARRSRSRSAKRSYSRGGRYRGRSRRSRSRVITRGVRRSLSRGAGTGYSGGFGKSHSGWPSSSLSLSPSPPRLKNERELAKRKAGEHNRLSPSISPKRRHIRSEGDHRNDGTVVEKVAYRSPETNEKIDRHGGKRQESSKSQASETKDEETGHGDSDDLSEFDFLKETLNDDNESVVFDEYEETLEHDETIFERKTPESKKDETVDLGDVLGHLFTEDSRKFSKFILVAPVPLRNDGRNCKDLKSQIGDQGVLKVGVFNKAMGSPCHYMLVSFKTTEAAAQWYDCNSGDIILSGDDSSKMRGYLHFVETLNWSCTNCKGGNFPLRTLCCNCYQAKDGGYSPVSVVKEPTKWVGISKLKSCFPTTESVLDSLPSLEIFNIQSIQMIAEPKNLPMGLCVFEVQSETEGARLFTFFRQQGRSSVYLVLNEKTSDSHAEANTDRNIEQSPKHTGDERSPSAHDTHNENDPLAPLFTNETSKNILLVAPVPQSTTPKNTKSALSLIESYLGKALEDDGVKCNKITLHIDKNVGAPCSYGLIIFAEPEAAAEWCKKHDNSLNIKINGLPFPTSENAEQSWKAFLHFCEDNWDCQNCQTANFFLRSLCHQCFFLRDANVPGPIRKSAATTRWVATSKLTDWFTSNEGIVSELKKIMKDLKITKIDVLRDPKVPVLPLGCVFETESLGESLRLHEFLHRTGRFSLFVTKKECFDQFTSTDSFSGDYIPKTTTAGIDESTPAVADNSGSTDAPLERTGLGAEPASVVMETSDISDSEVSEPVPDHRCKNYLLWWNKDAVRYSDILNDLFLKNPSTQVSPGQTIFVGPLPGSLPFTKIAASALQMIVMDKLEQDGLPLSSVSIHAGELVGGPCIYGLVYFSTSQDAEVWREKHKGGLVLPRPIQPTPNRAVPPRSEGDTFFKTFVYYCKTNWRCRICKMLNFGLRSYCFSCHGSKEPGPAVLRFSNTSTNCVCIRKFQNWAATEELLFAYYPFLRNIKRSFKFKVVTERSGIPLGTCVLETNNLRDAQLLFSRLQTKKRQRLVRYGILSQSIPERGVAMVDSELKEIFVDDSPTKMLFLGPIRDLATNTEALYKALFSKEGADCDKVECCLAGNFGAPYDYCLVHFNTVESSTDWYRKCQGRVTLKHKPLPDGKFQALEPVDAFLHFTEVNWSCECGRMNFPVRSICFNCYKQRNAKSAPFIMSDKPTKWLGVRLTQWYAETEEALCLPTRIYERTQPSIASVRLYNDPKIPKDNFRIYIIEAHSVEAAVSLQDFYMSSLFTRSADFVELKGLGPGGVTSQGKNITLQAINWYHTPKRESVPKSDSFVGVLPASVKKQTLVCPDHETILWTSVYESHLNKPPTNVIMISLCPGDRQLPDEARAQIQNSLREADADHESIIYSFKGDVGSPFSYCLVSFASVDSAKSWMDKCNGTFQFSVTCPDDMKTPLNFQNFYSLQSSSSGGTTHSIKSKLHYSASNWLCSCDATNFPLRSLCHNCFKNKDKESGYESVPDASSFVGIKLTEYRDLFATPFSELRKLGLKIHKVAVCFDPAVPRDPCGVVMFEAQSVEFGTELYNFLTQENSQNRTEQTCKTLMAILEISCGITYFNCPKSLEPKWTFCISKNWDSFFVNERPTNIITVDMDLHEPHKFEIPLEQFGGRLRKYRHSMGFIPGFWLIHFPTPQAAKGWYDANKGRLEIQNNSEIHSLHFTTDVWQCPKCSSTNFPARLLCHRCFRHRIDGFSPLALSDLPTRWVGISAETDQKLAVSSLNRCCRENFHLNSVEIFTDPNVRQDGTCVLVFEVSSSAEGSELRDFFKKSGVKKCWFCCLLQESKLSIHVQQSQALTRILEAPTLDDNFPGDVSEQTAIASKFEFPDDISKLNKNFDGESKARPIDVDCLHDSKPADSNAGTETVPIISEGAISEDKLTKSQDSSVSISEARGTENECFVSQNDEETVAESVRQSESSHERLGEELDSKSVSKEHVELSVDCHVHKNGSLSTESQTHKSVSQPEALEEVQASSSRDVDLASDVYAKPDASCLDSECLNVVSTPMDTYEPTPCPKGHSRVEPLVEMHPTSKEPCDPESLDPKWIPLDACSPSEFLEDQTSIVAGDNPSSSSQKSDGHKMPFTNPEQTGDFIVVESSESDGGAVDLKDSSADEAALFNPTSGPNWIPAHPASEVVIVAPITKRPCTDPTHRNLRARISKILTDDHAGFRDISMRKSLEYGSPLDYYIVHFASPDSAMCWLKKHGHLMKIKESARRKREVDVHLYFGSDDWVCVCGVKNYFERTFCHGCFKFKTRPGFSTVMPSSTPSLWVAVRLSTSAKNTNLPRTKYHHKFVKKWMVNLQRAGVTSVTKPTFHFDPGIKGGDNGFYLFRNSSLEESEKVLGWFNFKHRAMYVTPCVPSPST